MANGTLVRNYSPYDLLQIAKFKGRHKLDIPHGLVQGSAVYRLNDVLIADADALMIENTGSFLWITAISKRGKNLAFFKLSPYAHLLVYNDDGIPALCVGK